MTTNFPTSIDSFVNPIGTNPVTSPDHAGQHANINDSVSALEAKVGINSSAVTTSLDYKVTSPSSIDPGHKHSIYLLASLFYPVGSIYMEVTGVNPNTTFGFGTWTAWGSGQVPVGVDAGQTEFNTVEKTGGEKTHTLTVPETPSHSHPGLPNGNSTPTGTRYSTSSQNIGGNTSQATYLDVTGGGGAHNNLQPYITCYMWKRTT